MPKRKRRIFDLACGLFRRMARYENEFCLSGDLEEELREREKIQGARKARLWFVLQSLKSVPAYLKYRFAGGFIMLKNYIVTAFRHIRRQRGFNLLNLFGLVIGISCFLLIMFYVRHELSFDRYHADADRIFRVSSEHAFVYHGKNKSAITPAPMAPALREDLPEVDSAVRLADASNVLISNGRNSFRGDTILFSEPELFDVFSYKLLEGDPEQALADPYSIILNKKAAQKYFGTGPAVGKILRYGDRFDLKVTGVLDTVPDNSHIIPEMITTFRFYAILNDLDITDWGPYGYYTYLKLKEGADPLAVEEKLQPYLKRSAPPGRSTEGFGYFLQPLTKIHLHSDLIGEISTNGNIKTIILFSTIVFLILVIACINYMNLVTARASTRGKEVGIRKIVGAKRKQIIFQFFGETVMLAGLAMLLSCAAVYCLLPSFNSFIGGNLRIDPAGSPGLLLGMTGTLLFIGLFAGSYPALVLSSFKPAGMMKGIFHKKQKGISFRNILVVFQFAVSIVLIIGTLVVKSQLHFIQNEDVGYSKDHIITMRLQDPIIRNNLSSLKIELLKNPGIQAVSASSNLPHRITNLVPTRALEAAEDDKFPMYELTVDYDFLNLFGIGITAGRNFSPEFPSDAEDAVLVNEAGAAALGYDDPVGREIITPVHGGGEQRSRIIGVIKDFNMLSLHQGISPLRLILDPDMRQRYLSIQLSEADMPSTLDFIKNEFQAVSATYPFEYEFFDDVFFQVYKDEEKLGQMFNAFGFLAVLIGCLGLFGLASFSIEQKMKVIGIRKVLGASVTGLILWLSRDFITWVAAANALAWPVAYILMKNWLNNFTFRISLGIGIFLIASTAALGLALVTVLFQTVKAAKADPVHALRNE